MRRKDEAEVVAAPFIEPQLVSVKPAKRTVRIGGKDLDADEELVPPRWVIDEVPAHALVLGDAIFAPAVGYKFDEAAIGGMRVVNELITAGYKIHRGTYADEVG